MPQSFPEIRLIATDVDGTLLNSQQQLNPAVEDAVRQARALGVKVRIVCSTLEGCNAIQGGASSTAC